MIRAVSPVSAYRSRRVVQAFKVTLNCIILLILLVGLQHSQDSLKTILQRSLLLALQARIRLLDLIIEHLNRQTGVGVVVDDLAHNLVNLHRGLIQKLSQANHRTYITVQALTEGRSAPAIPGRHGGLFFSDNTIMKKKMGKRKKHRIEKYGYFEDPRYRPTSSLPDMILLTFDMREWETPAVRRRSLPKIGEFTYH